MKINRVLVCGNDPISYVYTNKLLNTLNYVTIMPDASKVTELTTKGLVYYEDRKMYKDKIKVITELYENDIYDVIIVTYDDYDLNKILNSLIKNKSKLIIFSGIRTNAELIEKEIMAASEINKEILFSSINIRAVFEGGITKNLINAKKILVGKAYGSVGDESKEIVEQTFDDSGIRVEYEEKMDAYLKYMTAVMIPIFAGCCKFNGKLQNIDKYTTWMAMAAMDEACLSLQKKCIPETPEKIMKMVREKTKIILYLYLRYLRKNKKYNEWINFELKNNIESIIRLDASFRKIIGDFLPLKNWRCLEKFLILYGERHNNADIKK